MKAVLYVRISKEDQSAFSLQEQIADCKDYCEKEKYELVDTYFEDGYSAKDLKRPEMTRMLSDIPKKKFNMIVVWRLDRLTRDTIDGLTMVKNLFKPNGVEFASVTEDIDTSTPDGYMMFTIRLSMAQNEREKIAARVTMGQMGRAKSGKRNTSAVPYGYDLGEELSLVINETESEVVRQIYAWFLMGHGRNKIATMLNERGVPAKRGKLWHDLIVGKIISNITNTGAIHWKRKGDSEDKRIIVHDTHEAIVSIEVYEQAQNIRERRTANDMSQSSYDFPFSTVVKCGECGRSYHGKIKMKGLQKRNYRCSGKYRQDSCSASDLSEPKLERLFLDQLKGVTINLEEPEKVIGGKDTEKERKKLIRLIGDSSVRKKNYSRAMGDGKMTYETFSELIDEETLKVNEWQQELDLLNLATPGHKKTRKDLVNVIKGLNEEWPHMSDQQKKASVSKLFQFLVIKKMDGVWKIIAHKLNE